MWQRRIITILVLLLLLPGPLAPLTVYSYQYEIHSPVSATAEAGKNDWKTSSSIPVQAAGVAGKPGGPSYTVTGFASVDSIVVGRNPHFSDNIAISADVTLTGSHTRMEVSLPVGFSLTAYRNTSIVFKVSRAVLYQGGTGSATVTILKANSTVTVRVEDTPPGISVSPQEATLSPGSSLSLTVSADDTVEPGYYAARLVFTDGVHNETDYLRIAVLAKDWLEGWGARTVVIIDSYLPSNMSNLLVELDLARGNLSGTSTVYCDTCKPDFSDIRVTGPDATTLLASIPAPISSTGKLFVVVPSMPSKPLGTILYVYYGNPTAGYPENAVADGFNGKSLGDLEGSASLSESTVILTLARRVQAGYVVYNRPPGHCFLGILRFRAYGGSGADAVWVGLWDSVWQGTLEDVVKGGYHITFDEYQDRIAFTKSTYSNGPAIASYRTTNIDNGAWHDAKILVCAREDGVRAKVYYDGSLVLDAVDPNPQPNAVSNQGLVVLGARTGGLTNYHEVDYFVFASIDSPVNITSSSLLRTETLREGVSAFFNPNPVRLLPGTEISTILYVEAQGSTSISVSPVSVPQGLSVSIDPSTGSGRLQAQATITSGTDIEPGLYNVTVSVSTGNGFTILVTLYVVVEGGWMSGWLARIPLLVENKAQVAGNATLRFIVRYGSGVNDGATLYCNGMCRPDFGDIRFTDSDGTTLLSYYVEKIVPYEYAVVWVRVPIGPGEAKTIYMYYGNYSATPAPSHWSNVFIHYDDCEGWVKRGTGDVRTEYGRPVSIDDVLSSCFKYTGYDPNGGMKPLNKTLGRGIVLDFYVRRVADSTKADKIGIVDSNGNGYGFFLIHGRYLGIDIRTGWSLTERYKGTSADFYGKWYRARLVITEDTVRAEVYEPYGGLVDSCTYTDTRYTSFNTLYILGGRSYYVDSLKVYPYLPVTVQVEEPEGVFYTLPPFITVHAGNSSTAPFKIRGYLAGKPLDVTVSATTHDSVTVSFQDTEILVSAESQAQTGYTLIDVTVSAGPVTGKIPVRVIVVPHAWLEGWAYRKLIVLENPSAAPLQDYVDMLIVEQSTGTDTGRTVHLAMKAQETLEDIRVAGPDGTTLLPVWVQPLHNGNGYVWFKAGTLPPYPALLPVYLYYGNPVARGRGDPGQVFLFFDDFDNLDNWETNTANYRVENGTLKMWGDWNGRLYYITSREEFTGPVEVVARGRLGAIGSDIDLYIALVNETGFVQRTEYIEIVYDGEGTGTYREITLATPRGTKLCGRVLDTNWHVLRLVYNEYTVRFTDDAGHECIHGYRYESQSYRVSIGADTDSATRYGYLDWVAVKPVYKYNATIMHGGEEARLAQPERLPILIRNPTDNLYAYPYTLYPVDIVINESHPVNWSLLIPGSIYFADEWGNPLYSEVLSVNPVNRTARIRVYLPYMLPYGVFQVYMYYGGDNPYIDSVLGLVEGEYVSDNWVKVFLDKYVTGANNYYTSIVTARVEHDHFYVVTASVYDKSTVQVPVVSLNTRTQAILLHLDEEGLATSYMITITTKTHEYSIRLNSCYYYGPELLVYVNGVEQERRELGCGDKTVLITSGQVSPPPGYSDVVVVQVDSEITSISIEPVSGDTGRSYLYLYVHIPYSFSSDTLGVLRAEVGVDYGYPDAVLDGWTYRYIVVTRATSKVSDPVVSVPVRLVPGTAMPDGHDIRVGLPNGTLLPFKVASFDRDTGTVVIHVKVPGSYGAGDEIVLMVYTGNMLAEPVQTVDTGTPVVEGDVLGVSLIGPVAVPYDRVIVAPGSPSARFPVTLIQPSIYNVSIDSLRIDVSDTPWFDTVELSSDWARPENTTVLVSIPSNYTRPHGYWRAVAVLDGEPGRTTGWLPGVIDTVSYPFRPLQNTSFDANMSVTYVNPGPPVWLGVLDIPVNTSIAAEDLAVVVDAPNLTSPVSWGEGRVRLGYVYRIIDGIVEEVERAETADTLVFRTPPGYYVAVYSREGRLIALAKAGDDGTAVIGSGEILVENGGSLYVLVGVYPDTGTYKALAPYTVIWMDDGPHILALLPRIEKGTGRLSILVGTDSGPAGFDEVSAGPAIYGSTYTLSYGEPATGHGARVLVDFVEKYMASRWRHSGYLYNVSELRGDGIGGVQVTSNFIALYRFVYVPGETGNWTFAVDGEGTAVVRIHDLSSGEEKIVTGYYQRDTSKGWVIGQVALSEGVPYLVEIGLFTSGTLGTGFRAVFSPPSQASYMPLSVDVLEKYGDVYSLRLPAYKVFAHAGPLEEVLPSYTPLNITTTNNDTVLVTNTNPYPVVDSVVRIAVPDYYSGQIYPDTIRVSGLAPNPVRIVFTGPVHLVPGHTYTVYGDRVVDGGEYAPPGTVTFTGIPETSAIYVYDGSGFRLVGVTTNGVARVPVMFEADAILVIAEAELVETLLPATIVSSPSGHDEILVRVAYAPPGTSRLTLHIGSFGAGYTEGLYDYTASGYTPVQVYPTGTNTSSSLTGVLYGNNYLMGTKPVPALGPVAVEAWIDGGYTPPGADAYIGLAGPGGAPVSVHVAVESYWVGPNYYRNLVPISPTGVRIGAVHGGAEAGIRLLVTSTGVVTEIREPPSTLSPLGRHVGQVSVSASYPVLFPVVKTASDGVKLDRVVVARWAVGVAGVVAYTSAPLFYKNINEILYPGVAEYRVYNPNPYPVYDTIVLLPVTGIDTVLRPDGSGIRVEAPALVPSSPLVPLSGVLEPGHVYRVSSTGDVEEERETPPALDLVKLYTPPYTMLFAQIGGRLKILAMDYDGDGVIVFKVYDKIPSDKVPAVYVGRGTPTGKIGVPYTVAGAGDPAARTVVARIPYVPARGSVTVRLLFGAQTGPDPDLTGPGKVFFYSVGPSEFASKVLVSITSSGYVKTSEDGFNVTLDPGANPYTSIIVRAEYLDGLAVLGNIEVSVLSETSAGEDLDTYIGVGYAKHGPAGEHHDGVYAYLYYEETRGAVIGFWQWDSFTRLALGTGDAGTKCKLFRVGFNPYTGTVTASLYTERLSSAHEQLPSPTSIYLVLGVNGARGSWLVKWIGVANAPEEPVIVTPGIPRDTLPDARPEEWDGVLPVKVFNPSGPLYDYQLQVVLHPGRDFNISLPVLDEAYRYVSFTAQYPFSVGEVLVTLSVDELRPGLVYRIDNGTLEVVATTTPSVIKIERYGADGIIARIYDGYELVAEGRDYDHDGYIEIPSVVPLSGTLVIGRGTYRQVYLPYYMERVSGALVFYVRVPYVPPGTGAPVEMLYSRVAKSVDAYYGPDKTFIYYHDFSEGMDGWMVVNGKYGSWTVEGEGSGRLLVGRDYSSDGATALVHPMTIVRPFTAQVVARPATGSGTVYLFAWPAETGNGISPVYWAGFSGPSLAYFALGVYKYNGGVPASSAMSATMHRVEVRWTGNGHMVFLDGIYAGSGPSQTGNGQTAKYFKGIGFSTSVSGTGTVYIKSVYVRAYAYPEPLAVVGNGLVSPGLARYKQAGPELSLPNKLPVDIKSVENVPLHGVVVRVRIEHTLAQGDVSDPGSVRFVTDYAVPTRVLDVVGVPLGTGTGGEYRVENGRLVRVAGYNGIVVSGLGPGQAVMLVVPGPSVPAAERRTIVAYDADGDGTVYIPGPDYNVYGTPVQGYLALVEARYTKVVLPYVYAGGDNSTAIYFVRIPYLPPDGIVRIWMYYGKHIGLDDDVYGLGRVFDKNLIYLDVHEADTVPSSQSGMENLYSGFTPENRIGAGFVETVAHAFNPFGNSDHYATLYYFVLKTTSSGNYYFYTNSDDASDALVYGPGFETTILTAQWYGSHSATRMPGYGGYASLSSTSFYHVVYRQVEGTGSQLAHLAIGVASDVWATAAPWTPWYSVYTSVYTTPVVAPGGFATGNISWYIVQWVGNNELKPYLWLKANGTVSVKINTVIYTFGTGLHAVPLSPGHVSIYYYDDGWRLLAEGEVTIIDEPARFVVSDVLYNGTFVGHVTVGNYTYLVATAAPDQTSAPYASVYADNPASIRIVPSANLVGVSVVVWSPVNTTASIVAPVLYYEYGGRQAIILASTRPFGSFAYYPDAHKIVFEGVETIYGYIDVARLGLNPDTTYVFLYTANGTEIAVPLHNVWNQETLWIEVNRR